MISHVMIMLEGRKQHSESVFPLTLCSFEGLQDEYVNYSMHHPSYQHPDEYQKQGILNLSLHT